MTFRSPSMAGIMRENFIDRVVIRGAKESQKFTYSYESCQSLSNTFNDVTVVAFNRIRKRPKAFLYHNHDQTYHTFLQSRPDAWEVAAIGMIIKLLREEASDISVHSPTRAHIVHLSSSEALPMIAEARAAGLPLTSETCFHYLVLSSESVPDRPGQPHT